MIPIRARLIARRHRDVVGRPVKAWRIGIGAFFPILVVGILVVLGVLLATNPFDSLAANVAFMLFFAVLMWPTYLIATDLRFVVCERGVIMGHLVTWIPLMPTYVIGGREIDPRTVCVVDNAVTAANEVDMPTITQHIFSFPVEAFGQKAVSFRAPWSIDLEADRPPGRGYQYDQGTLYMFANRRAAKLADALLHAIGRDGAIPPGFVPHEGLRPIPVTGNPEDAVRQIPGAPPPRH